MSQIPNQPYPHDDPDNHIWIAFVIDGEVAVKVPFPVVHEHLCAVLASDPKLIVLSGEDRTKVMGGWTYDGTSFIGPTV